MTTAVLETQLDGLNLINRGKVRDLYEVDGNLLLVTSDRISAYDCIIPTPICGKGKVLTALATFWFDFLKDVVPNHVITSDVNEMPESVQAHADVLAGRTLYCHKAEVFPVECVVRGYITGSGWKDYQATGSVCGIELPEGLVESQKLETPIFTPATKAEVGEHDENISFERMCEIIGEEDANALRDLSIAIYSKAEAYARSKGIIIADTKFEFGRVNGEITLIDEVLTPDSSRFWPADDYEAGRSQDSYDKQFVRDYLSGLDWDKTDPAPGLPDDIVAKSTEKYLEAYTKLTGESLEI
jgi:phosphoribosylaminoimidazole-succinocarboxamide synthase